MPRSRVAVQALAARVPQRTAGLAWRRRDVLVALLLYPMPIIMWLWPYALADVADTVIGPAARTADLVSWLRMMVIVFGILSVVSRRNASWWLRGGMGLVVLGIVGNWSRDRLYDAPLTLSVLLLLSGLAVLTWRLAAVEGDTARRKLAERELAGLRIENANLKRERGEA